jgi:hypothetical protein
MLSAHPIDPALTAIAVAYRNEDYIADVVLPRIRVGKQEFKFIQYLAEQFFQIAETAVGRRSQPNQVALGSVEITDSTADHALDGGVPRSDIENADERYDPLGDEVMFIQELIAIVREIRAAGIVFNPATYAAGLKVTLAGNTQFNHPDMNGKVIKTVNRALDVPLMRPNQMVFGQSGWTEFRSLPEIVEACLGTAARSGNVSRQQVAELFEVKEVVVGAARGNAAKKGQPAAMTRLWGRNLALLHKAPVPQGKGAVTFGGTFQFGDRIASQWEDKNIGMRGGIAVRTGESVKERVIAAEAGYFFEDAFAAG